MFQDFQLLSFSLGQNVAGRRAVQPERAKACLQKAGFGDRLAQLPDGLETKLYKDCDEKGVQISGGEAQKIALARALYKDAPFVVLDEPTAALDPIAEMEVYEKFNEIVGDRTAVYISHRLSSCRFCDSIAVFDHGSIIQRGTHESLLQNEDGKYFRAVERAGAVLRGALSRLPHTENTNAGPYTFVRPGRFSRPRGFVFFHAEAEQAAE